MQVCEDFSQLGNLDSSHKPLVHPELILHMVKFRAFECEHPIVPVPWEIVVCQKSTHYKREAYFWTLNSILVTNTSPNAKNTLSWLAWLSRHLSPLCSVPYCLGCSGSLWNLWTVGWSHPGAKRDSIVSADQPGEHGHLNTTTSSCPWTWDAFSFAAVLLHSHAQSPSLVFVMLILVVK